MNCEERFKKGKVLNEKIYIWTIRMLQKIEKVDKIPKFLSD